MFANTFFPNFTLIFVFKLIVFSYLLSHTIIFLQVGDRLRLDVQNYRPEKILFARAVKLKSFRKLGRETGVVCGVRDQGFGFVRSHVREINIFFRISEVITESGTVVRDGDIVTGSCLSFDVVEELRGVPNSKLRAVRVQLLPPNSLSMEGLSLGISGDIEGNGNGNNNGNNNGNKN